MEARTRDSRVATMLLILVAAIQTILVAVAHPRRVNAVEVGARELGSVIAVVRLVRRRGTRLLVASVRAVHVFVALPGGGNASVRRHRLRRLIAHADAHELARRAGGLWASFFVRAVFTVVVRVAVPAKWDALAVVGALEFVR